MFDADTANRICQDPHTGSRLPDGGSGFFLSDDRLRYIQSGAVNIFIGPFDKTTGLPAGTYLPVAGLEQGDAIFPMPVTFERGDTIYRLLAIPLPGSEIRQSTLPWLALVRSDDATRKAYELFVARMLSPLVRNMPPPQTKVITRSDLAETDSFQYPENTDFRPGHDILWASLEDGFCTLNGDEEQLLLAPGSMFPLSAQMWLHAMDPVKLSFQTTTEWLANTAFTSIHEAVLTQYMRAILVAVSYRKQRRQQRQARLEHHEKRSIRSIFANLRSLISPSSPASPAAANNMSQIHAVIHRIAAAGGTTVEWQETTPGDIRESASTETKHLLDQNNFFYRTIALSGAWWLEEGFPVIAFRHKTDVPVALFHERGTYWMFDPESGQESPVSPEIAETLQASAITVYARLPARPLTLRDITALSFYRLGSDMKAVFVIGLIGGLVSLVPARITSTLFNTIIPSADYFQLFQVGVILFSTAFTATLFELSRSILMLRIKTRSNYQLQAAMWGRLLNLPAAFFGKYAAGDLAQRVMGVDAMRAMLTDNVSMALMSMIFALPNLALMLYYSRILTGIGLLALIIYTLLLAAICYVNYGNQKQEYEREGKMSGFAFQAISGIAKIRMSLSENRAFAKWANIFSEKIEWKIRRVQNMNLIMLLSTLFPPLMTGIFFLIIGSNWKDTQLNTGNYLAFNSAFAALVTAFSSFAMILPSLLAAGAIYKRLTPVMEATPEIIDNAKPAGVIDGNVELRNVTYRYGEDLHPVLNDVTITAKPGQFIAIVGPSGAGKSTLARLLLGFYQPESGGVYYGGIDMASVNPRDIRRQIGTVLQGGGLMQTSIYDNIAGASGMTLDDAWEAARLAGCDADIRAMPMGMHTRVHNGTVSGGQRQRLLIARALVRRPRILIFDEATSALDNETQAHVSKSLERLNATRIVIAHRLSTIIHADTIYVMDAGRVVQQGTFHELIHQPGLFQLLAKRQML